MQTMCDSDPCAHPSTQEQWGGMGTEGGRLCQREVDGLGGSIVGTFQQTSRSPEPETTMCATGVAAQSRVGRHAFLHARHHDSSPRKREKECAALPLARRSGVWLPRHLRDRFSIAVESLCPFHQCRRGFRGARSDSSHR